MSSNQEYNWCPFCAKALEFRREENRTLRWCPECRWTNYPKPDIAVSGIAIRMNSLNQPETLMVLRNRNPHINKWSFPAGFVNYGEHPDTALVREIREETGLIVLRFKLMDERISNDDPRSPNQLSRYYKILVTGQIENNDGEENSEIKWQGLEKSAPDIEIAWKNHEWFYKQIKENPNNFLNHSGWISSVN